MGRARRKAIWTALIGLSIVDQAAAAGYALREQSATALGNAFAGATAGAEDVSYMFFNPAALARLGGYATAATLSRIRSKSKLKEASASTVRGIPIVGRRHKGDIGEDETVPALYAAAPLGGRVRLGLGTTVPFGQKTKYPADFVGRYHALESELRTVNLNPAIAVRAADWLNLGIGLQVQYIRGRLTNAVDFGTIGAMRRVPGAVPGAQDGIAKLDGDDWGYGYTAGLLVEPLKGTRFGLAYRSKVEHTLKSDVKFRDDVAGVAAVLRAKSDAFQTTDAEADLTTPASLSFGVHQDIGSHFALMAEAQWTGWSEFRQAVVEFENPAQPDELTEQRWNDSWFFALGATWRPLNALTLRTGVAYDESPVSDRFRTPRIPDENRYWLSVGASWRPRPWLGFDAGYSHIWVKGSEVNLSAADPGNQNRGNLSARYEGSTDIATVGLSLKF